MSRQKKISPTIRVVSGSTIALLALLLLTGGWVIPFQYESFTILYKFGFEKTLLRAGKMIGISLALLLFFQIVLASRFTFLEQIFSVKIELQLHRINGTIIAGLAILHPLLIKASEDFTLYTFEEKYYPEFLGIGLLCTILFVSGTAFFRPFLKITYPRWLLIHRFVATIVIIILPTHVLWVSDTFMKGLPQNTAVVIFSLTFLLIVRIWLKKFFSTEK
jgi:hypothetical protein